MVSNEDSMRKNPSLLIHIYNVVPHTSEAERDGRGLIWFIWSIWSVSFNQTNQADRTAQMNKKGFRTSSASC